MIVVSHRGAAGHHPENSLAGIRHALGVGSPFVEVDVRRAAGGELVLMHDALVDRTTDGTGYVADLEASALRLANGEPVPTLARAAAEFADNDATLWVDLLEPEDCERVLDTLSEMLTADRFVIGSFHHKALMTLRRCDPAVRRIAAFEGVPVDGLAMLQGLDCWGVALGFESVDETLVRQLSDAGRETFGWTVNDRREIERAARLGFSGIITDFPERALRRPSPSHI